MIAAVFFARMRRGLSLRASSCATASSEIDAGFGGRPTDVDQFWLCRLKPITGFEPIAQRLQRAALGRLQAQRVAVDVDALRVAARKRCAPSGLSIGTTCTVSVSSSRRPIGDCALAANPVEQIEERGGRGRLVAVHLRPQQHVRRGRGRTTRDAGRGPRPTCRSSRSRTGPACRARPQLRARRRRRASRAAQAAATRDARPSRAPSASGVGTGTPRSCSLRHAPAGRPSAHATMRGQSRSTRPPGHGSSALDAPSHASLRRLPSVLQPHAPMARRAARGITTNDIVVVAIVRDRVSPSIRDSSGSAAACSSGRRRGPRRRRETSRRRAISVVDLPRLDDLGGQPQALRQRRRRRLRAAVFGGDDVGSRPRRAADRPAHWRATRPTAESGGSSV